MTGNWQPLVDYASGSPSKIEGEAFDSLKHQLGEDLKENLLKIQGAILDLQRKAGEAPDYDGKLYSDIETTLLNIDSLQKVVNELASKLDYLNKLVDGLKVSQQLSDGYQKLQQQRQPQGPTVNTSTTKNYTYLQDLMDQLVSINKIQSTIK